MLGVPKGSAESAQGKGAGKGAAQDWHRSCLYAKAWVSSAPAFAAWITARIFSHWHLLLTVKSPDRLWEGVGQVAERSRGGPRTEDWMRELGIGEHASPPRAHEKPPRPCRDQGVSVVVAGVQEPSAVFHFHHPTGPSKAHGPARGDRGDNFLKEEKVVSPSFLITMIRRTSSLETTSGENLSAGLRTPEGPHILSPGTRNEEPAVLAGLCCLFKEVWGGVSLTAASYTCIEPMCAPANMPQRRRGQGNATHVSRVIRYLRMLRTPVTEGPQERKRDADGGHWAGRASAVCETGLGGLLREALGPDTHPPLSRSTAKRLSLTYGECDSLTAAAAAPSSTSVSMRDSCVVPPTLYFSSMPPSEPVLQLSQGVLACHFSSESFPGLQRKDLSLRGISLEQQQGCRNLNLHCWVKAKTFGQHEFTPSPSRSDTVPDEQLCCDDP
ncbi:hypothetical protein CB1_001616020 [Camelus ferus]|nr:hypothetical protein CB1_001616020 [Camelus ferus]